MYKEIDDFLKSIRLKNTGSKHTEAAYFRDLKQFYDYCLNENVQDFKQVDLLKYKSYTVGRALTDDEAFKTNFSEKLKVEIAEMKPFIQFLNDGLK